MVMFLHDTSEMHHVFLGHVRMIMMEGCIFIFENNHLKLCLYNAQLARGKASAHFPQEKGEIVRKND